MKLKGNLIQRLESCRLCLESTGELIAIVDYWDIKTSNVIQCPRCNHIQLDPMLTREETRKGCLAYYIEESLRVSRREQERNLVRNFRRGVLFGYGLKRKGITPIEILELGPGSGYFSAGLQFVFPQARITAMDINPEILAFNAGHHSYKTILEIPDNLVKDCLNRFDLVIARDILEHVADVSWAIDNVYRYLKPNGLFHFITPNGHEDVWKHYLTFTHKKVSSELLINHVNYFDGKGLGNFLIRQGFHPVQYYTYKIKTTLKGRGWSHRSRLKTPVSQKKKADFFIKEKTGEVKQMHFKKNEVLDEWYIKKRKKWVTCLYSWFQHHSIVRLPPRLNVGHEIYGLFQKKG